MLAAVESAAALESIAGGLGIYYLHPGGDERRLRPLSLAATRTSRGKRWSGPLIAVIFVIMAPLAMSGNPSMVPQMPDWFKSRQHDLERQDGGHRLQRGDHVRARDDVYLPPVLRPPDGGLVDPEHRADWLMALSAVDPNFQKIVTKPDNVPIVALVFLLGFFTWLATAKAVKNDDRIAPRACRRWRSSTTKRCSSGPISSIPS